MRASIALGTSERALLMCTHSSQYGSIGIYNEGLDSLCGPPWVMGRRPTKRGSEYHLTDQLSLLEKWSNVTLFLLTS